MSYRLALIALLCLHVSAAIAQQPGCPDLTAAAPDTLGGFGRGATPAGDPLRLVYDRGALAAEFEKGHGRGKFEERRLAVAVVYGLDRFPGGNHGIVGNGLAVDADALVEPDQVRRGVKADAVPGLLQDGGQGRRDGTLAVGSGNVDGREGVLRIAEALENVANGRQAEDDAETAHAIHGVEALGVGIG